MTVGTISEATWQYTWQYANLTDEEFYQEITAAGGPSAWAGQEWRDVTENLTDDEREGLSREDFRRFAVHILTVTGK